MKQDQIEELYSELRDLSQAPPSELWDHIEARLHPKKKRRALFWLWGSAAAILVVLVGYMLTNTIDTEKPDLEVTDIEHVEDNDSINATDLNTPNTIEQAVTTNEAEDTVPANTTDNETNDKTLKQNQEVHQKLTKKNEQSKYLAEHDKENLQDKKETKANTNENYAIVTKDDTDSNRPNKANPTSKNDTQNIIDLTKEERVAHIDSIPKPDEDALIDITEALMAESEPSEDSLDIGLKDSSKWSIELLGGLSNTASDASIQGTSINTTAQNDFVYTLKLGYAVSDRLVIKSGIGNNVLGQAIDNIGYLSADTPLLSENPQNIISNQEIFFVASPGFASEDGASDTTTDFGTLEQQFNYIQIPLEVTYDVLKNQNYTLSFGLGANVNFLTNNRVFLDDEQIGESLGVNTTVFGAVLNTNLSYRLTKRMNLFVEPSYNYFQKPVDNSGQEFSNTQLRIQFGLRYKL